MQLEKEKETREAAERCRLLVTAGSDYHGTNKAVSLGQTGGAGCAGGR